MLRSGGGVIINESAEPDKAVGISVIRDMIHVQSTERRITIVDNLKKNNIPFLFVKPWNLIAGLSWR